jgi:nucleoside-diphosphate-sugar epimerase
MIKNTFKIEDLLSLNNKSIIITGATGLIGYNLLKLLKELVELEHFKFKVYAVHKNPLPFFMIDLAQIFDFIQGDLVSLTKEGSLPNVDIIIHGAGYGQPEKFMEDPYLTIELNTHITNLLLKKTRDKFLFISTSEIYSGLNKSEFCENEVGSSNTDHPRAPYIESKRLGESLTLLANKNYKINANVARLSLAYGPGVKLNDSRVLNQLIHRGLTEHKIILRDSGKNIRNYLYISSAVYMLILILIRGKGEIYNVGGESEVSIRELGGKIAHYLQVDFDFPLDKVEHISPINVKLNLEKTISLIGPIKFSGIDDGLLSTIEWYKFLLKNT